MRVEKHQRWYHFGRQTSVEYLVIEVYDHCIDHPVVALQVHRMVRNESIPENERLSGTGPWVILVPARAMDAAGYKPGPIPENIYD